MGIVVDEKKAKESVCTCYQIGPTREAHDLLCFSDGIIGTLNDRQDNKYCPAKDIKPATTELKKRINKFTDAIHSAQKRYHGEGIEQWLELTGQELRKRGIEL